MDPQLSSARLYIVRQRSAARCGAVPCPSVCGAVSCGAVRSFEHTAAVTKTSSCSTRYDTETRFMYVFCVLVFLLSLVDFPLSAPMPPRPPPRANIARTAVQNVTSASAQHSTGQLALHKHLLTLLSIRYSHQKITGLFFLPHLCTCSSSLHSSLRERSGRRQQPSEAEPCAFFRTTQSTTRYWAKYQVPGTVGTCVYSSFCSFVVGFVLHPGPLRDFFLENYTRATADQTVTLPTYSTAQTGQSAPHKVALGIIKSLVALNHGPLLSAPFSFIS